VFAVNACFTKINFADRAVGIHSISSFVRKDYQMSGSSLNERIGINNFQYFENL